LYRYDVVKASRDFVRAQWKRFRRMLPRLQVVIWVKLSYSRMQHSLAELWKKWTQPKEVSEESPVSLQLANFQSVTPFVRSCRKWTWNTRT
jgi:hypothetical protein